MNLNIHWECSNLLSRRLDRDWEWLIWTATQVTCKLSSIRSNIVHYTEQESSAAAAALTASVRWQGTVLAEAGFWELRKQRLCVMSQVQGHEAGALCRLSMQKEHRQQWWCRKGYRGRGKVLSVNTMRWMGSFFHLITLWSNKNTDHLFFLDLEREESVGGFKR